MPKKGTTEITDPPWRIERCLNCSIPEKFCLGEPNCAAQHLMEKDAMYQSVMYGKKKGMRTMDIAGALHVSEATVTAILNGRTLKCNRT